MKAGSPCTTVPCSKPHQTCLQVVTSLHTVVCTLYRISQHRLTSCCSVPSLQELQQDINGGLGEEEEVTACSEHIQNSRQTDRRTDGKTDRHTRTHAHAQMHTCTQTHTHSTYRWSSVNLVNNKAVWAGSCVHSSLHLSGRRYPLSECSGAPVITVWGQVSIQYTHIIQ